MHQNSINTLVYIACDIDFFVPVHIAEIKNVHCNHYNTYAITNVHQFKVTGTTYN